jgi:molybdopterin synthase catalytic subunit/molybdopterin converting factor small subunit
VKITVQFFSFLRQWTGQDKLILNLPDNSTVGDALTQLHAQFPQLEEAEKTMLIAVGMEFTARSSQLHDGDVLSLMPPLQGGSVPSADELLLTNDPIDVVEAALDKFDGEVGAVATFWGIVRRLEDGKPICALEYTAYRGMAEHQFHKVLAETHEKWKVNRIRVIHRLGVISVGDASLLVRVESAHRAEAFAAAQFIIDELKQKVPIWKKAVL